MIQSPSRTLWK